MKPDGATDLGRTVTKVTCTDPPPRSGANVPGVHHVSRVFAKDERVFANLIYGQSVIARGLKQLRKAVAQLTHLGMRQAGGAKERLQVQFRRMVDKETNRTIAKSAPHVGLPK